MELVKCLGLKLTISFIMYTMINNAEITPVTHTQEASEIEKISIGATIDNPAKPISVTQIENNILWVKFNKYIGVVQKVGFIAPENISINELTEHVDNEVLTIIFSSNQEELKRFELIGITNVLIPENAALSINDGTVIIHIENGNNPNSTKQYEFILKNFQ